MSGTVSMSNTSVFTAPPHPVDAPRAAGSALSSTATATIKPASSLKRQMAFADAELAAHGLTPLGVHDLRLPERIRHHADVAHPYAVGKARAERLDDGFLGRKTHGEKAHGPLALLEQRVFLVEQQPPSEMLAELEPGLLDALRLKNIGADTEDHERAATISAFIFATAPRESVEQRLRHHRVTDVQLHDFGNGGHRRHVVVVKPVPRMDREPERLGTPRRDPDALELERRSCRRTHLRKRRYAAPRPAPRPRRWPRAASRRDPRTATRGCRARRAADTRRRSCPADRPRRGRLPSSAPPAARARDSSPTADDASRTPAWFP